MWARASGPCPADASPPHYDNQRFSPSADKALEPSSHLINVCSLFPDKARAQPWFVKGKGRKVEEK